MANRARAILRSKLPIVTSFLLQNLSRKTPVRRFLMPLSPERFTSRLQFCKPNGDFRQFHDGRPRGPLWRGKKLIGKEALLVILGLKRFKDDEERLDKFIKTHVLRLLKMDMIAVLSELERQEDVFLACKIFRIIQKQDWYKPDVFLYKDLIMALAKGKKLDQVMELWEMMRKENLFPDCQTFTKLFGGS
ncbi:pentatricopeptide repeat-containing protein [Tripterygium wilfordii]|uniref:Pentatricopeptide repeat-containing protein n=1 Tax=Tripterygium wilfordii TaxID=458696 RepID=A0A7J7DDX2_TRIWF|nr:pentatricopeptide repeat-containing protein [Tripterygium wilfordii]